jgi:prephenate dehydrogenase
MSAAQTRQLSDALYSLYREATLAALKEIGADDVQTVQNIFLHNKRWSIMRQKDIKTHLEQIKKLIEKGQTK